MHTTMSRSRPTTRSPRREFWYVSDEQIQTGAAARKAVEVAARVTRMSGQDATRDEHALFLALHTCAYRATRRARGQRAAEAEREAWRKRWRDIRECIVRGNLGLAYSIIGRLRSTGADHDDLLSEAMYGLVCAIDRYNPHLGYRFSTYACNCMIRRCFRHRSLERQRNERYSAAGDTGWQSPGDEENLGDELTIERMRQHLECGEPSLSEVERHILSQRFPLDGQPAHTFKEIAQSIGLSKERVRQLQNVGLRKLRELLEADPVLR